MIEPQDKEKFKKLGISSITALSLILPQRFEDYRLNNSLIEGEAQVVDATIERISRTPKSLQLTLFAHNFGLRLDAVFFRPKPFMMRQFSENERCYLYGVLTCKAGHCQISHPKKITEIGLLMPRYKTALQNATMLRLVERYVSVPMLEAEGLPLEVARRLEAAHKAPVPKDDALLYALKFAELFDYMKALRQKRRYFAASHVLKGDYKTWAAALPFTLTQEQSRAIEEIAADLAQEVSARRMIVGDVGCGKTMVILAAALIAQPKRVVLMAPTTILARQLYEEAQKFLPHLRTALITNASKVEPLDAYDFIIGTHALLYRELPESALVMVDEQHRFGTAQRARLEQMLREGEAHPHFLQFTATPIPRTQAMIDSAHIDVSLITTTPFEKDITSRVIGKSDFAALLEQIKSEVAAQRQVLIVYPLVQQSEAINYQSIDEARHYWETRFEGVHVTHGKDREKEAVLLSFRESGTILLATTVVEVGISLPRLSTVVIVGAERLGLSTLHQLRGRVSRNGLKGYCYLFTHSHQSERLEAFVRTKSGFDIAALDLKFRQSGDLLLGREQSGKQFVWVDLAEDEKVARDVKAALALTCKA
ncbi:MAG: ATP-dependent DNA helicase RecG [Campylobacterales bacterium]|nr:ATP-dependent DNA helicase RecG [Campylobacterales bacterium]